MHARCTLQRASLASWERRYDAVELAVGDHTDGRLAGWGIGRNILVDFLQYVYIYIYLVAPEESWVGFFSPKIFSKSIEDFLLL